MPNIKFTSTIGSRLTLIIGGIILAIWLAFAISLFFFVEVKKQYSILIQDNIPRVELANLLAQNSTQLASIAASILGSENGVDKVEEANIKGLANNILASMNNSVLLQFRLSNEGQQRELADRLVKASQLIQFRKVLNDRILSSVEQLRWLNLDVQDEAESIGLDYGYNIELATNKLINSSDINIRRALAEQINVERDARDLVMQIGNDASLVELFLLQSAVVRDGNQLRQFQSLIIDAVTRSNQNIQKLPKTGTYSTIVQSMEALDYIAHDEDGILATRAKWIESEKTFFIELENLQKQFGHLQTQLHDIGTIQSRAVNEASVKLTRISNLAIGSLLSLTIFTGLVGAIILYRQIYQKIVHPIDQLAAAMRAISSGEVIGEMPLEGTDEIGKMTQSVYAFQNSVNEREQAFQLLKKTQAELVQAGKMAALGNLSAGISHEINQPLAAIMQRLYLLENANTNDDAKGISKQVEKIKSMVNRMNSTITSLKRFARRSEHLREEVYVWQILKDAVTLLKSKLKSGNIDLDLDENTLKVWVLSDPILAEQVLINIISNAIDSIIDNCGTGTIKIHGLISNDIFKLYVQDDGIGLQEISIEQAFDPFVSTKGAGIGLGLGLSISYNIARDLGGNLKLEPNQDRGVSAIFEMQLVRKK